MKKYLFTNPDAKLIEGGICAPLGFTASGIYAGIKQSVNSDSAAEGNESPVKQKKNDLALVHCSGICKAAGVYTTNLVKGACIDVTKRHIADGYAQAIIVNSGNANTCNADGKEKSEMMCNLAADALRIKPEDVIVASTGVIGQVLPIKPIEKALPALAESLSRDGGTQAARAIMTTDTYEKEMAVEFELGGKKVRIGGMCKGSGMIHVNMATMLCFITTDIAISREHLRKALRQAVGDSFNMVSVDGDTSTNDMLMIMASGHAGNKVITDSNANYDKFVLMLKEFCVALCREIARDGEGATKLLVCNVRNAKFAQTAKNLAKSVICSSLFKAAMFGADANWGRVLCAMGYSGEQFDPEKVSIDFQSEAGKIRVCENGAGVLFSENEAKKILSDDEVYIEIDVASGTESATAFGCDLTYDYVKINGDYRT
ncbi:MAG: bifunctional glutamate N-acetyltransferase/amino-acid acetyltransferase ArgJ [Oscillospiraceae bacterium]|jgi:glutamate N-acetyltransferase/amino-acid N-acetyltransferase|nr:bifunctional glutamate N-acetyltransferase/amino-acid acetyltransferase ArgJ [Oscillospiraceae bacterium]